eukprot:SM000253S09052  [mRNA]  locus=s253:21405:23677:- [translate_table: standard]
MRGSETGRAAARPAAPPAWAAIVQVCRRWRRLARAAITEVSLQDRTHGGTGGAGPRAGRRLPLVTRLSLDFGWRGHRHAPELGLLSAITTLTDLRVRLAGDYRDEGEHVAVRLQRTLGAMSSLGNIVRALTLHNAPLDLPLAGIAGLAALESLAVTHSRVAGEPLMLSHVVHFLA